MIFLHPHDVVADVVHLVCGVIRHVSELAQVWEESLFQVFINLFLHFLCYRVSLDRFLDLVEPWAARVRQVEDVVFLVWDGVQLVLCVVIWPIKMVAIQSLELGVSAIDCPRLVGGLDVHLIGVVSI